MNSLFLVFHGQYFLIFWSIINFINLISLFLKIWYYSYCSFIALFLLNYWVNWFWIFCCGLGKILNCFKKGFIGSDRDALMVQKCLSWFSRETLGKNTLVLAKYFKILKHNWQTFLYKVFYLYQTFTDCIKMPDMAASYALF